MSLNLVRRLLFFVEVGIRDWALTGSSGCMQNLEGGSDRNCREVVGIRIPGGSVSTDLYHSRDALSLAEPQRLMMATFSLAANLEISFLPSFTPEKGKSVFSVYERAYQSVCLSVPQLARENSLGTTNLWAAFVLMEFHRPHEGVPQIEVKFDIDVNGILSVTAIDKGNWQKQDITIAPTHYQVMNLKEW
ncbi:stromal 70 kDa heat shock-related protein chloroplastic [Phtheirospermum japonicum]|uniref:Stromal 70 kDa heat shock-related protein chloroplastic n=1 Tax=Phtheirospermum japonicum TaxID=374723 RepID=A0A830B8U3_9LAMI|nr:stromal 70 kDa heat shock-related protein chloroplastic [Phtheirospermum japonicum]